MYKKIKDEPSLIKDIDTNSILETNIDELIKYKNRKQVLKNKEQRINNIEDRMNNLELKIDKILNFIEKINV